MAETLYKAYAKLIVRRDELEREADLYQKAYVMALGGLIEKNFQLKLECIKYKKVLAEIVAKLNSGEDFEPEEISAAVDMELEDYYKELNFVKNLGKDEGTISEVDVLRIKKIYRNLAKKIHPDIRPDLADDEELGELWEKAVAAYKGNDLKAMVEVELLVNQKMIELGIEEEELEIDNLEEKIAETEEEIEEIKTTIPYIYKEILEDEELLEEKKQELEQEIEEYEKYKKELLGPLAMFGLTGLFDEESCEEESDV